MIIILNNLGFINLNKAFLQFEEFYEFYKAKSSIEECSDFLFDNNVILNDKNQITDGQNIFGLIKYLN